MSTNAADNLRPITTFWWLPVLFGVVTLGVGVFFVVSPHETLSTFTVIAGIFLLVDGVLAIFGSIFGKGDGRGLLALIGVLSAIAGLVLIKKPFDTLVVFTLILGVWFVVTGVVRFVVALGCLPEGRGGNIVTAIVDLIAGIVILAWPELGLSTVAVIIGIVLIVRRPCSSSPAGKYASWTAISTTGRIAAARPETAGMAGRSSNRGWTRWADLRSAWI